MLKSKTMKISEEWGQLRNNNSSLAQVVWDLAVFVEQEFKKDVVMTEIFRTQLMQDSYYGKGTKKVSPHQLWQAVDIRERIYTATELDYMKEFLVLYDKYNGCGLIKASKSKTFLYHDIGRGKHFHIQFLSKNGSLPPQQMMFTQGMIINA